MSDAERDFLAAFARSLSDRAGGVPAESTSSEVKGALLELARLVAHGSERVNAPLSTYLAGRYAAERVAQGAAEPEAVAEALEQARSLLPPEAS